MALEPGPTGAAAVTQDGWWNRTQGSQEPEPGDNPIRPVVPRLPAPPNVPADAIAAGAVLGQTDKVAAIGIEVALPSDGVLDSLTLRLKEAPGDGANVNSDMAKVVACPATVPWGPDKNANWVDRPESDCELAKAEGVRAEDGTWTFDLTPIGTLWTDPFAPLGQHGVLLAVDPAADPAAAPGATQVTWLDFESGNVIVELLASVVGNDLGAAPDADSALPPADEPPAPQAEVPFEVPAHDDFGGAAFDPFAHASGGTSGGFPTATIDVPEPAEEEQAAFAAAPRGRSGRDGTLRAQPAVGFWEDIPTPTALLLPVALGLALLIGLVLGPAGRPLPVWAREGGLSRALARRDAGGPGAQS